MTTNDPRHYDVIVSPVITEKSTLVSEANQVIFNVARNATKVEIKSAIENLFKVKVKAVNTIVRKGKLWLVSAGGDENVLAPRDAERFRVGETPEWVRLDTIVDGKALRMNYSGTDYHRDFTP